MKNIKRLLAIIAMAFIAGSAFAYERSTTQTQMLTDLNAYRFINGVANVTGNDALMKSAQDYACKMNAGALFQHVEASGITPQDRMISAGYRGVAFGENINRLSTGASTSALAIFVRGGSPGHKANMLNANYNEVGVGQCGLFRVQNFGTARKTFTYPLMAHPYNSGDVDISKFTTEMKTQYNFDNAYTYTKSGVRIYLMPRVEITDTTSTLRVSTNTTTTKLTTQQQRLLDRLNKIYAKIFNGKKLYLK